MFSPSPLLRCQRAARKEQLVCILWIGGKSTEKLSQVPGILDAPADTGLRALDSLPATPRGHLHLLLQDSCLLRQESLGAQGMPCYVMQSWVWHPATVVFFYWSKQITNTIMEGREINTDVNSGVWTMVVCLLLDPRLAF